MIYWYELTVELHGVRVLTTDRSSGGSLERAKQTLKALQMMYPKSKGYTIAINRINETEDVTDQFTDVRTNTTTVYQHYVEPAIPPLAVAVARYYESISRLNVLDPFRPKVIDLYA